MRWRWVIVFYSGNWHTFHTFDNRDNSFQVFQLQRTQIFRVWVKLRILTWLVFNACVVRLEPAKCESFTVKWF